MKDNTLGRKALDRILKEGHEILKKKDSELREKSKPLHELVFEEKFLVLDIVGESVEHYVSPHSEMMIGGSSPTYNAGFSSVLTLGVSPYGDIPVRVLKFYGVSPLRAGEKIIALIPRYEEKSLILQTGRRHQEKVYLDRVYRLEEEAVELSLLRSNDDVVQRRDRSINYRSFVKD